MDRYPIKGVNFSSGKLGNRYRSDMPKIPELGNLEKLENWLTSMIEDAQEYNARNYPHKQGLLWALEDLNMKALFSEVVAAVLGNDRHGYIATENYLQSRGLSLYDNEPTTADKEVLDA